MKIYWDCAPKWPPFTWQKDACKCSIDRRYKKISHFFICSYCRAPKREANKRRTGEVLFDLGVRTYVRILSVTLGKDRHIQTVTLGKDHHIHIRIYACATLYWQCQWAEGLKRLLWRDGEGWQERVSVRLVEGEGFCCSLYKQPLWL